MCGIAAIFAYDARANRVDREQLLRTCDRMGCRGPDGEGIWLDPAKRVALGHRRLAIIDVSTRGAQPMTSANGQTVISFNGEIYNYRALRRELESRGHRFVSDSDTEVLLQLYEEHGEAMVHKLRGMYAFAIWDGRRCGLLLVRDAFGIKPLYYADDGRTLRAASEVKALLCGSRADVDTRAEPAGHVGFFLWGSVPEPYTLYRGIRALPAGSALWVQKGGSAAIRTLIDLRQVLADAERQPELVSDDERTSRLGTAVRDSIDHHLVADVDCCVFLSAGLDSSTIAALVAERTTPVRTVTLGFREYRGTAADETEIAADLAARYGTEHRTVWITRADFDRDLDRLLDRMDQPTTDGVNTYFVSQAAAKLGLKVALSGLGGDELFAGYPSFRQIPRIVSTLTGVAGLPSLGRGLRIVTAPVLTYFTSPKYAGVLEYGCDYGGAYLLRRSMFTPWELPRVLDPEIVRAGWRELSAREALTATISGIASSRLKITALEAMWYMRHQLLRDTDWASMSHGVEVRVPLVDLTLWKTVAQLAPLNTASDKTLIARTPRSALPATVIKRPKTGFVIPVQRWCDQRVTHANGAPRQRGLQGWARQVYSAHLQAT
jgi:asparagine synthase (glutamine-hydrolysing)